MAATTPWAELPADLLVEIARRLPCLTDRVNMSRMCRGWRAAVPLRPHPPQLPWLLLPYRSARRLPPHISRRASFFCLLCSDTHRVRVRPDTGGARYFGSYDGGWLFLAHGQTYGHALINLHSDERIPLPDTFAGEGQHSPRRMVMVAATLSSPPVPAEQQCIGAAIVNNIHPPNIMFWHMGHQVEVAFGPMEKELASLEMEDVIYYNGAFHFLSQGEQTLVFTPEFGEAFVGLEIRGVARFFLRPERRHAQFVQARYVVESRGELLMVQRCSPLPELPTSLFSVFQMTRLQVPHGDVEYTWTELPALDGRMLFVAPGCSRSFEVADFPGFADGVYFLDDNGRGRYRQYTCNDNGNWSEPPPRAHRWFPDQPPSNYSSPVWFLH